MAVTNGTDPRRLVQRLPSGFSTRAAVPLKDKQGYHPPDRGRFQLHLNMMTDIYW